MVELRIEAEQDVEALSRSVGERLWAKVESAVKERCQDEGKPVVVKMSLTDNHFNILARILLNIAECPEEPKEVLLSIMCWAIMSMPMGMLSEEEFIKEVTKAWHYREKLNAPKEIPSGSN